MRLRPNSVWSRAILGTALLWVATVTIAYFAVHKPLSGAQLTALIGLLATAVGWAAATALANLLGRTLLNKVSGLSFVERLALQIGLGLALIAYVVLALGWLGAYQPWLLWLLVLLPFPLSAYRFRQDVRRIQRPAFGWLAAFVGLAGVLILIRALAPPTAWDALVYHLTGPKLYLEAGRIHHELDLAYLGFPKAGSMLFLLGHQLAGPGLAQLFHATFFALAAALAPSLVRAAAPSRGWLAVAIVIAVPSAALVAGWAYVEWMAAFGAVASYILIRASAPNKADRALVLAAFFAALALNTKYTAVWVALGLSLMVLWQGRSLRRWLSFLLMTAIFVTPFLLTNLALTGNPVYPFFFEGVFWDAHRAAWFSRFGTGLGPIDLATAPWEATIWGLEGGFYEGHPAYGATIGPLLLALIPLVALRLLINPSSRNGDIRGLLIVAGIAYAGWWLQLATSSLLIQSRLLFPVLPFLAALAAIGFDTLGQLGRWGASTRFIIGGLVAFVLVLTAASMVLQLADLGPVRSILGAESRAQYLERRLGFHYRAMRTISDLDASPKVRFLWEPRSYYCDPGARCEPDALLDRWWHDRQHSDSVQELVDLWRAEGVTHVLFNRVGAGVVRAEGFDPLGDADWEALEQFLENHMTLVSNFGEAYELYELQSPG